MLRNSFLSKIPFLTTIVVGVKLIEYGTEKLVKRYESNLPEWVVKYVPSAIAIVGLALTLESIAKISITQINISEIEKLAQKHNMKLFPVKFSTMEDLIYATKVFNEALQTNNFFIQPSYSTLAGQLGKGDNSVTIIGGEDNPYLAFPLKGVIF